MMLIDDHHYCSEHRTGSDRNDGHQQADHITQNALGNGKVTGASLSWSEFSPCMSPGKAAPSSSPTDQHGPEYVGLLISDI